MVELLIIVYIELHVQIEVKIVILKTVLNLSKKDVLFLINLHMFVMVVKEERNALYQKDFMMPTMQMKNILIH